MNDNELKYQAEFKEVYKSLNRLSATATVYNNQYLLGVINTILCSVEGIAQDINIDIYK